MELTKGVKQTRFKSSNNDGFTPSSCSCRWLVKMADFSAHLHLSSCRSSHRLLVSVTIWTRVWSLVSREAQAHPDSDETPQCRLRTQIMAPHLLQDAVSTIFRWSLSLWPDVAIEKSRNRLVIIIIHGGENVNAWFYSVSTYDMR